MVNDGRLENTILNLKTSNLNFIKPKQSAFDLNYNLMSFWTLWALIANLVVFNEKCDNMWINK